MQKAQRLAWLWAEEAQGEGTVITSGDGDSWVESITITKDTCETDQMARQEAREEAMAMLFSDQSFPWGRTWIQWELQ